MLGTSLEFTGIIQWITYLFPSLGNYLKYVGPAIVFLTSVIGVFTNLLPEPNHKYSVPNVTDLQTELGTTGGLILKIAFFTRRVTIVVNWVIATAPYGWFYNTTNVLSNLINRVKGASTSDTGSHGSPPQISTPSPFVITVGQKKASPVTPLPVAPVPPAIVDQLAQEPVVVITPISEQKTG